MRNIFIIISIVFSFAIGATQKAIVTSEKAIVYADLIAKTPIGYLKKGQQILIGNKTKSRNKMIAVALIGQVGWIKKVSVRIVSKE